MYGRSRDAQGWAHEVAARLSSLSHLRIFAMTPPEGIKDLSEAHCRGLDVVALVREMQREAVEVSGSQNDHKENHQQSQTFTGKGEEKTQGNQTHSDGGRGASENARDLIIIIARTLPKRE
jgi:hypothetical protein